MELERFEMFIIESRLEFRNMLMDEETNAAYLDLFRRMLAKCCSDFEEETLKENLQDEFKRYLDWLKAEGE